MRAPAEIERDADGFLPTGDDLDRTWPLERRPFSLETSMPGVLQAGDARRGSIERVAAAVDEGGATAVRLVHRLLPAEPLAAREEPVR